MNLLLFTNDDLAAPDLIRLTGRRLEHLRSVHRAEVGGLLKIGRIGGSMGTGQVVSLTNTEARVQVMGLEQLPPPKLPLTLILALPRPKVLNRVIAGATSLGVARIILVNAWKVEKSYWKSPRMSPENLLEQQILGLEQAVDTELPRLETQRLLRPFVEDELPALAKGTRRLIAHPGPYPPCPRNLQEAATLVVGPEGGFIPQEVALFQRAGFEPVDLGARILRVETAVAALVGRLY